MASTFASVFSPEELATLANLPAVLDARTRLDAATTAASVYFSVSLSNDMKAKLRERLGLDLSAVAAVPMRWIKGEMAPHVDRGAADFQNTYLMYVNDCPGELVVDGAAYPIEANTAYVFNEGLSHETRGAADSSRLLLGPMSEAGVHVGAPVVNFFPTYADAYGDGTTPIFANLLGSQFSPFIIPLSGTPDVGTMGGYTSWRIAPSSTGSSSQLSVYPNGSLLNNDGYYYLYPANPCFLEGTKLLCQEDTAEVWKPIETIKKGDLVKTSRDGFKAVAMIGHGTMENPATDERIESRLYVCTPAAYPELTEDLVITGCHSILVPTLTDEQRVATAAALGQVFVTDRRYRLMAHLDERAKPWQVGGKHTIWHLALEHADEAMNYGVYANGGLLVETCCIKFMRNKSNMTMV